MKKCLLIGIACMVMTTQVSATNLMDVYKDALQNDPTFKAALATQMEAAEAAPQALSELLPNLSFTGDAGLAKSTTTSNIAGATTGTTKSRYMGYSLSLTQSIFNIANWKALSSAKYSVKAATATYNAAALSLMTRTANAYFAVLQAQDVLRYIQEKKAADYQQYIRAKERLKVGLATITDVYNAKAAYDGSVADYVADKNDLANKQEDLKIITGTIYPRLDTLRVKIPMATPQPSDIDQWVDTTIAQNWDIKAARYSTLAAKESAKSANAGHMPTLSLSANYANNYQHYFQSGNKRVKGPQGELDLTFPLFSGGSVSSIAREKMAAYALAQHTQENTYRSTIADTRKAYLAVITSISQVQAAQQSIVSYGHALEGTKAQYNVGTNTMVDVLKAQEDLYLAQKNWATSRYNYIINSLTLKEKAGILHSEDLQNINQWLLPPSIEKPKLKTAPKQPAKRKVIAKKIPTQKTMQQTPSTYLQVAAYHQLNDAKMMLNRVKKLTDAPCDIYPGVSQGKPVYRLQIGPITHQKAVYETIQSLQSAGFPKPMIVRKK